MSLKELFSARDMTQGRPWKRIMEFAMPMLVGNLALTAGGNTTLPLQEATAIMEGARAEAQRVLQDAAAKADQMVEEEEILRRARAAAGEATADAQAEMARLRQMTFDYLDNVMEHIDRSLSESLSDLRMERNELNNHR